MPSRRTTCSELRPKGGLQQGRFEGGSEQPDAASGKPCGHSDGHARSSGPSPEPPRRRLIPRPVDRCRWLSIEVICTTPASDGGSFVLNNFVEQARGT